MSGDLTYDTAEGRDPHLDTTQESYRASVERALEKTRSRLTATFAALGDEIAPCTLSQAIELGLASAKRDEPLVPAVLAAVVDFLTETAEEIEGSELRIPGYRAWLHTTGQVAAWLEAQR